MRSALRVSVRDVCEPLSARAVPSRLGAVSTARTRASYIEAERRAACTFTVSGVSTRCPCSRRTCDDDAHDADDSSLLGSSVRMTDVSPITDLPQWTLRAATAADVEAIASVWHPGWREGHLGHVPDGLLAHRTFQQFRSRTPARLDVTTVATLGSKVLGFVMAVGDEIEQLYVAAPARGTGVAPALLRYGEHVIANRHHRLAWLAVATGNTRARRFYAREGWLDAGAFNYPAAIEGGAFIVPCRRYEKLLTSRPDSHDC